MYGSVVWGVDACDMTEEIHVKLLKYIHEVRTSTQNTMPLIVNKGNNCAYKL